MLHIDIIIQNLDIHLCEMSDGNVFQKQEIMQMSLLQTSDTLICCVLSLDPIFTQTFPEITYQK